MLLNEVLGGIGRKTKRKNLEEFARKLIKQGSQDGQDYGNKWFNTMIGITRDMGEQLNDTIRSLRVKFNQAMAIDDFNKALHRYNTATDMFYDARAEASAAHDKEFKLKYDNDDWDVYPRFKK